MLELFVRGYALKLRPACVIGRYRHKTGGMAARELTQYLEPNTVTLFKADSARSRLLR